MSLKRLRIAAIVALSSFPSYAFAACGDQGGPGYRAADGNCVGWEALARSCGNPPTLRCKAERVQVEAAAAADQGSNIRRFMDAAHARANRSGKPEGKCDAAKDPNPELTLTNRLDDFERGLRDIKLTKEQFDRLLRDGKKSLIETYYNIRKLDEECEQKRQ